MPPPVCRHCQRNKTNRPRGLCWTCYYTPGLRDLYPSTSKYARKGTRNFHRAAPLPATPTTARPGTPEKLAVLAGRSERGESLFHPADEIRLPPERVTEGCCNDADQ